jgi:tetratricopeptide (TPR) repeat protein
LLLILILGTVVTGIAAVAVHGMQVRRFAQLIQQRARDAKAEGRSEEAMELYQRYIALVPRESVDSQIELGILLADAGQNARSSRILEAALRVDSTRDDARRRLAKLELQDRSYLDARQNLDVLIANSKDDRDLAELLDWRAQCELAIGDDVTAAASLELAIEKAPERLESYAKLAAIREARLKDPTGAQAALDAMVATNQDAARAYVFRGAHLLRNATGAVSRPASGSENDAARDDGGLGPEQRQAALEAALSDSRRALELAPDDDAAIALGINCLAANKQFDEARELARRGLMLRPKNATMYSLLAKIELRNRSRGAAIDWLERGLKVDPANQSLLWDYALLLIDERRGPDAEKVVPALVRAGYPLPPIEFLKSLLLIELESWHAASRKLEQIRAALVPWPELSKQADFRLGQCYQRLGRSDLQLTAYRRAASADPNWVPARLGVAEALSATGKIELAMEEYDQITRLPDSDQARGVALLQRVRLEIISNQRLDESKRNWSRANQILDALEKSSPDQSQVAILRAEILFAQGDRQQAEAALRASLDRSPETLDYWLGLSVLAERRGDLAEAQRLLDGAEARLGDSVEVRLARARLLHNRSGSDAREAIRKLAQPSDSYSSDDKIRLYTGMANVTLAAQDYDETERLCELVARERKSFLPVRLLLFDLALRAKRTAAMEQLLTEVEQIEGKGPLWNYGTAVRQFVLALEARTARNAGVVAENCRQAKQHLAEARTARQNWSRIPLLLAEIDELQEDDVAAISNYYKAIELGERSSTILSRVVFLLYQHRQYAKADELIGHLKQQGTPFSNDMVRLAAEVALGLQDNESALKWTTEFTKVSREVYEHLWAGQKLFILGQHAEAEQSFRKAIAIDESSAEPRVALVLHLADLAPEEAGFEQVGIEFKGLLEGEYGVKLYILDPRAKPNHIALRKRCTVLPTINRKSRELYPKNPGEQTVTLQQAIWVIPIDDTHCEEMRITVYPETPEEKSYHGGFVKQAKQRERKSYDRRFYGEIRGNVPLEDKAMVESQGAIVDRTLEHPGYGDRAILLLRKMIRDGVAAVANGDKPKGVLQENLAVVDLDIGVEQYPVDAVPEEMKSLLAELQQQSEQI